MTATFYLWGFSWLFCFFVLVWFVVCLWVFFAIFCIVSVFFSVLEEEGFAGVNTEFLFGRWWSVMMAALSREQCYIDVSVQKLTHWNIILKEQVDKSRSIQLFTSCSLIFAWVVGGAWKSLGKPCLCCAKLNVSHFANHHQDLSVPGMPAFTFNNMCQK